MTKRSSTASQHGQRSKVRLMLHTINGVFPYLTPYLLEQTFPATEYKEQLLLGVSVRETTILPDGHSKNDVKKPSGYTFSGNIKLDPWLKDFQRITVPTFDLISDLPTEKDSLVSSQQQLMLWTHHGRQSITPATFYESSKGLASNITVPLFDSVAKTKSLSEKISVKNKAAALTRTLAWSEDFLYRCIDDTAPTKIWIPVIIQEADPNDEMYASQLTRIRALAEQNAFIQGVALCGLEHVNESEDRRALIEEVRSQFDQVFDVTALNTTSLGQVLDAARSGCNVIGTSLPQKWAQHYKAFIVDIEYNKDNKVTQSLSCRDSNESVSKAQCSLDKDGCIDLQPKKSTEVTDHPWFRDSRPVVPGCKCLVCQIHSRAYIYHLACAKELLAESLLFVHNLHHLLSCVQILSESEDGCQAFCLHVIQQLSCLE